MERLAKPPIAKGRRGEGDRRHDLTHKPLPRPRTRLEEELEDWNSSTKRKTPLTNRVARLAPESRSVRTVDEPTIDMMRKDLMHTAAVEGEDAEHEHLRFRDLLARCIPKVLRTIAANIA